MTMVGWMILSMICMIIIGQKSVRDDPNLLDDGGDIQISRKRLAVRFSTVKSPLYLTEHLSSGPPMLWALACRPFVSKEKTEKRKVESHHNLTQLHVDSLWVQVLARHYVPFHIGEKFLYYVISFVLRNSSGTRTGMVYFNRKIKCVYSLKNLYVQDVYYVWGT